MRIESEHSPTASFFRYRTYDWMPNGCEYWPVAEDLIEIGLWLTFEHICDFVVFRQTYVSFALCSLIDRGGAFSNRENCAKEDPVDPLCGKRTKPAPNVVRGRCQIGCLVDIGKGDYPRQRRRVKYLCHKKLMQ